MYVTQRDDQGKDQFHVAGPGGRKGEAPRCRRKLTILAFLKTGEARYAETPDDFVAFGRRLALKFLPDDVAKDMSRRQAQRAGFSSSVGSTRWSGTSPKSTWKRLPHRRLGIAPK